MAESLQSNIPSHPRLVARLFHAPASTQRSRAGGGVPSEYTRAQLYMYPATTTVHRCTFIWMSSLVRSSSYFKLGLVQLYKCLYTLAQACAALGLELYVRACMVTIICICWTPRVSGAPCPRSVSMRRQRTDRPTTQPTTQTIKNHLMKGAQPMVAGACVLPTTTENHRFWCAERRLRFLVSIPNLSSAITPIVSVGSHVSSSSPTAYMAIGPVHRAP